MNIRADDSLKDYNTGCLVTVTIALDDMSVNKQPAVVLWVSPSKMSTWILSTLLFIQVDTGEYVCNCIVAQSYKNNAEESCWLALALRFALKERDYSSYAVPFNAPDLGCASLPLTARLMVYRSGYGFHIQHRRPGRWPD